MFDNEISYIEGGSASGFYTVEDTQYPTRYSTEIQVKTPLHAAVTVTLICVFFFVCLFLTDFIVCMGKRTSKWSPCL